MNDASHDFDKIKQEGCDYDKEKVLNIDVDKILGLKGNSDVREEVDSVASEFEFTKENWMEMLILFFLGGEGDFAQAAGSHPL